MKKILILFLCLIPLIGLGQSQFKRGIMVGITDSTAVVDSLVKYGDIFRVYSGANRIYDDKLLQDASLLNNYAPLWTDTTLIIATKTDILDIIGGGGVASKFYYLKGNVETTDGLPNNGDSLLTHTNFIGKHVTAIREGQILQQHTNNTEQDGFWFNNITGTLTFRPVLSTGEQIEIWATNTIQWESLLAEGGDDEPPATPSPLLDSLIASYSLDEVSGVTANDNVASNDGSIDGTVNQAGKFGVSVALSSATGDITIPYNASMIPGGSIMSVSMWIYINTLPSALGGSSYLYHQLHSASPYYTQKLLIDINNYLYASFMNTGGTEYTVTYASALSAGQWYHVVAVLKGTGLPEIWLNGAKVATGSVPFTGTLYQSNSTISLGNAGPSGTDEFRGRIDEVNIFQQALSSSDIALLFMKYYPFL